MHELREALVQAFPSWQPRLGSDHILDLSLLGEISDTALTSEAEITLGANGLPLAYMQAIDGEAYGFGGVTSSYLTDAVFSLASCAVLAFLLRWRRKRALLAEALA